MSGKGTPATRLLASEGVPHTVHTYEPPRKGSSYGEAVWWTGMTMTYCLARLNCCSTSDIRDVTRCS